MRLMLHAQRAAVFLHVSTKHSLPDKGVSNAQVCGRDWNEHSSETGGYYSCNRSAQADLDGPAAVGIFGIRSYISSLCGRVQVANSAQACPNCL